MLEIRTSLDIQKKRQLLLQKQLEEADFVQAQMSEDKRHEKSILGGFLKHVNIEICSVTSQENLHHNERAERAGG